MYFGSIKQNPLRVNNFLKCIDYAESNGAFKLTAFGKTLVTESTRTKQLSSQEAIQRENYNRLTIMLAEERKAVAEELISELDAASVSSADYARLEKILQP